MAAYSERKAKFDICSGKCFKQPNTLFKRVVTLSLQQYSRMRSGQNASNRQNGSYGNGLAVLASQENFFTFLAFFLRKIETATCMCDQADRKTAVNVKILSVSSHSELYRRNAICIFLSLERPLADKAQSKESTRSPVLRLAFYSTNRLYGFERLFIIVKSNTNFRTECFYVIQAGCGLGDERHSGVPAMLCFRMPQWENPSQN